MAAVSDPRPRAADATLKKGFTLWSAFSVAFAVVSPIIAVYSVLGVALEKGGPGSWWGFLIVMFGALAIGAVLAQLASRWPFEGSIYQWSLRLGGPTYGWFAGWAYIGVYVIVCTTLAYGVVEFLPPALGIDPFGKGVTIALAFVVLCLATLANTTARRWLKILVVASITAEVIGSVGVGTVLMFFHHHQPFSIVTNYGGHGVTGGFGLGGALAALGFLGWAYNGFESAAAIAEEVDEPARNVPKAVLLVIVVIALIAMYSSLAIILAIPDPGAVLAGKVEDPVADVMTANLGAGVAHALFAMFMVSFFAGLIAAQTAVSRVVWAYARDGVLPGSRSLVKLSGDDRLPVRSVLAVSAVVTVLLFVGLSDNAFATLVTFTTGGFFIAFGFAIFGYLRRALAGEWRPGPFTLGRWSIPIALVAAAWCVFMYIDLAYPRSGQSWFEAWGVLLMTVVAAVLGAIVYRSVAGGVRVWAERQRADTAALESEAAVAGGR
jgi:amino acid transporter